MNIEGILFLLFLYFYLITCTFFTVQIAALKGRRRRWGWLGFLLGILGFAIVCFVPNAKGVEGETNPIKALFRKLRGISPIAMWILVGGVVLIVGGSVVATHVSTFLENRVHEKELMPEQEKELYLAPSKVVGKVASIAVGDRVSYAVTESGDLYGWGKVGLTSLDESGKVYQNVKKICAAGETIYLLTADHTLYARGDNSKGLIPGQKAEFVTDFVKIESDVKDMALSQTAGAILKNSGNLYVVGTNTYGQLGCSAEKVTNTNTKLAGKVTEVVVTARSLYYLNSDGVVFGVGNNAYGQFGLGNKDMQPAPVKLTENCSAIAAGDDFLVVLKKNGTVWSAGNNCYGQLGREDVEKAPVYEEGEEAPAILPAVAAVFGQLELEGVTRIEAGAHNAFAFIGTEVYAWGHNHLGQLGSKDGNLKVPTLIHRKAAELVAGIDTTLILSEDGKLLGAGNPGNYRLGGRHNGKGFGEIAEVKS
ncbi:MAG: hypothetical protein IJP27_06255 [Clostridia bacterium]|nr:hypothetical protein [Clostridia bacterium]